MIKKYWEITVRDYDIMEKTGRISQFCRVPFISKLFIKKIRKELNTLLELLHKENNSSIDDEEIWKARAEHKINGLRIAYFGLVNALNLSSGYKSMHKLYHAVIRKKIKRTPNIEKFQQLAKDYSGITVENYSDLVKLKKFLQLRIDKYHDIFGKKGKVKPQTEKRYLMSIVFGVISHLNLSYNPSMTVIEFIEARERAESLNTSKNA